MSSTDDRTATPATDADLEARVETLLASMTLAEKASLTAGDDVWHLPAVPRLGIDRLKMSDGPSGVRGQYIGMRRSLSFPCGLAAGASWDVDLLGRYGATLAAEARAKGVHVLLGPTVCIPRTPLGGRTFESFAEDPVLSSALTVAYVRGVQDGGVACCVKHFACNDQEHERMTISAEVDQRTLREVHLRPFEAAVTQAGTWSIMSAYNRVNGTWCGEHPDLLGRILKDEWGFDGVVVSDWLGTHTTGAAASAGLDVEMPGPAAHLGPRLAAAVEAGELDEAVVDGAARRILRLAARTGLLDRGASDDEPQDPDDPGRRRVAHELAVASTVVLRNDGVLPIAPDVTRVAVIGPNAVRLSTGGGGSSEVVPHRERSFVEELATRLPGVDVVHEPGCSIDRGVPLIDPRLLGEGMRLELYPDALDEGPAATEVLCTGRFFALGSPAAGVPIETFALRATATFTPDASGPWQLAVTTLGEARVLLDGEVVLDNSSPVPGGPSFFGLGSLPVENTVDLVAGSDHELIVELHGAGLPVAGFELCAAPPQADDLLGAAVAAAAEADVAVVVVGSNAQWETEGADRPDLRLVGDQDELVRAVAAANPRTVVVLNNGGPVETPWSDEVGALLAVWYPGEEGATALADVVVGAVDPGGRLPITFPRRLEDNPTHGAGYPGVDDEVVYGEGVLVGHRHYDAHGIEPAFAFGHGLSYTTFAHGEPTVVLAGRTARVVVPVTNTGDRTGTEVVQCYVGAVDPAMTRPVRELQGFAKVVLAPGETTEVAFDLDERAFSVWDEASAGWVVPPGAYDLSVGASSRDLRHTVRIMLA